MGSRGANVSGGRWDIASSLVLVMPLWLAYVVGIAFAADTNRADLISAALWRATGHQRDMFLLVHAVVAAAALLWAWRTGRLAALAVANVVPVVAEAALYAATLVLVLTPAVGLLPLGSAFGNVVSAFGAGVHEELVFRLGLFLGGYVVLRSLRIGNDSMAWLLALAASSVLFAVAHHVGLGSEPWSWFDVVFRGAAGCIFALVFWYRSLAHAVYAHALYDLYVLVSPAWT